jgi:chromate transporter
MDRPSDFGCTPVVTRRALFFAFLEIGLSGFGGVLPWARRMLVERRGWLTEKEFTEALSLGQVLPGPNIVNVSIAVGTRFHGAVGAALAFSGLILMPLVIILVLGALYAHYGHFDAVRRFFAGVAAAAAGLVLAMGIELAIALPRSWAVVTIMTLAFFGAAVLRLPMVAVLAVVAPISVGIAWWARR